MINVNANSWVLEKAEKYTEQYELSLNSEDKEDALFFVNKLKSGINQPFIDRLNVSGTPVTLSSILINSGSSSTQSRVVTIAFEYSEGTPTHYRVGENVDLSGAEWIAFTSNISYILSSGYGTKTIYGQIKNSFGETSIESDNIDFIEAPLSLNGFSINNGNSSTVDSNVTLNFDCVGTPTHYIASENLDFAGANWIPYIANPAFILSTLQSGIKTVYIKLKNATTETPVLNDSIELIDTTSVVLNSVAINSGASQSFTQLLNVIFNITNVATEYRIGLQSNLSDGVWTSYTGETVEFAVSGYGNKTIYAQVRNATSYSSILSDSIEVVEPVVLSSISINNGDASTSNPAITIAIDADGGNPTHYRVGMNPDLSALTWNVFAASSISFTLPDTTAGSKTVYVQVKNLVNESSVLNDTIEFTVTELEPLSAVVSFLGGNYVNNNVINYGASNKTGATINQLNPVTSGSYTAKQLKSKTGDFIPWYWELRESLYPINSESAIVGYYLANSTTLSPVFTGENLGVYEDEFIDATYALNVNSEGGTKKGRMLLTLPNGTYTFKFLMSVGNTTQLTEEQRAGSYYKINASGVDGVPTIVGQEGFTGYNNNQFNCQIENIVVTDGGTIGNVQIYLYNIGTTYTHRPALNLIEITKVS